jgi:hypothetical protein
MGHPRMGRRRPAVAAPARAATSGCYPLVAVGRATSGRSLVGGGCPPGDRPPRPARLRPAILNFFFGLPFFIFLEALACSKGLGFIFLGGGEGVCVQHPHFLRLTLIFGSVKSSILHGTWRFHFYQIFLLKLKETRTFISTIGILVS